MYSADEWPIAAAMLPFQGATAPDGTSLVEASPSVWAGFLQQVVDVGFTAVDPLDSWLPLAEMTPARFAELQRVLADLGLSVPSISTTRRSIIDPVHGDRYLELGHALIERAPRLGATVVNFGLHQELLPAQKEALWFWLEDGHHDDLDNSGLRDLAVSRFRELGDHAASVGIEISLEMYEDTYIGTADLAVAFIEDVAHPAVGLNPDLGNLVRLHRPVESPRSMLDKVLPYTNFWHIKNYARDEDRRTGSISTFPVPLVMGVIDYRYGIRAAIEAGFRGPFVCENYGTDGLGVCAINQRYIRDVLRSALRACPGGADRGEASRGEASRGEP
jgi:sugar phosphate isomerase/epimerase